MPRHVIHRPVHRPLHRVIVAVALLLVSGFARVAAQGGPPMITDDPGTPGPDHWEINLGWTVQRLPGLTVHGLPVLDANYGVGDRIQINYQAPYGILVDAAGTQSSYGDSQLALKWRYYDGGDSGWQLSIYPRVTFENPGSHSNLTGITDSSTTFLMPAEVVKDLGFASMDIDVGHLFSTDPSEAGWMGGIAFGRDVVKGWELDAETHVNASNGFQQEEWIVNVGTRIDCSEHFTLMSAIGSDLSDTLGPRSSLLTYLGFQLRF